MQIEKDFYSTDDKLFIKLLLLYDILEFIYDRCHSNTKPKPFSQIPMVTASDILDKFPTLNHKKLSIIMYILTENSGISKMFNANNIIVGWCIGWSVHMELYKNILKKNITDKKLYLNF